MPLSYSLAIRAVSLVLLIVLFQVGMARVPSAATETKRRWQHALTGHILVQTSYILPKSVALFLLVLATLGMFVWRTLFHHHFLQVFGPLLRPAELTGTQFLPGAFYFLLGTAITVWMVDATPDQNDAEGDDDGWIIPRYAVECLALADPVASWIGSTIPSPKLNASTSLSGCIACFVTAFAVGWFMLDQTHYHTVYTLSIGALACTIAEGLPFGNDNLNIPILTALAVDKLGR